tara:strand:- start:1150 stop:1344 length:195 start_codon:yes stop_codon:yes gene_type:complete
MNKLLPILLVITLGACSYSPTAKDIKQCIKGFELYHDKSETDYVNDKGTKRTIREYCTIYGAKG